MVLCTTPFPPQLGELQTAIAIPTHISYAITGYPDCQGSFLFLLPLLFQVFCVGSSLRACTHPLIDAVCWESPPQNPPYASIHGDMTRILVPGISPISPPACPLRIAAYDQSYWMLQCEIL